MKRLRNSKRTRHIIFTVCIHLLGVGACYASLAENKWLNQLMPQQQIKDGYFYYTPKKNGEVVLKYDNGSKMEVFNVQDHIVVGEIKSFHKNGQLMSIIPMTDGYANGTVKGYDPEGQLIFEGMFKKSVPCGIVKVYHKSGYLLEEALFSETGEITSVKEFYPNGQIQFASNYKDLKPEGKALFYYPDGKLKYEADFKSGILHGEILEHDENGRVFRSTQFRNGEMRQFKPNILRTPLYSKEVEVYADGQEKDILNPDKSTNVDNYEFKNLHSITENQPFNFRDLHEGKIGK